MAEPKQLVSERITIGLAPKTVTEMAEIIAATGLSKTAVMNHAVALYAFYVGLGPGHELLVRSPEGELQLIKIL
jgi:hypothetical protein